MEASRAHRGRLAWAVIALAALGAGLWLGRASIESGVNAVIAWCRLAGPWAFFGAMAILPVFGFSLFAFVAAAGPVFAPVLGVSHVIGYGVLALGVNVTLSYVLAAGALRPLAERIVAWFGYRLPDVRKYGGWELVLMVRLLPGPPFGLQSCALGIAHIPFRAYLVTSVAVPALYYCGMVFLGSGLADHDVWAAAAAAALITLVAFAVHRLRRRLWTRWRPAAATAAGQG